jgi:hypothetical protein
LRNGNGYITLSSDILITVEPHPYNSIPNQEVQEKMHVLSSTDTLHVPNQKNLDSSVEQKMPSNFPPSPSFKLQKSPVLSAAVSSAIIPSISLDADMPLLMLDTEIPELENSTDLKRAISAPITLSTRLNNSLPKLWNLASKELLKKTETDRICFVRYNYLRDAELAAKARLLYVKGCRLERTLQDLTELWDCLQTKLLAATPTPDLSSNHFYLQVLTTALYLTTPETSCNKGTTAATSSSNLTQKSFHRIQMRVLLGQLADSIPQGNGCKTRYIPDSYYNQYVIFVNSLLKVLETSKADLTTPVLEQTLFTLDTVDFRTHKSTNPQSCTDAPSKDWSFEQLWWEIQKQLISLNMAFNEIHFITHKMLHCMLKKLDVSLPKTTSKNFQFF